MEKFAKNLQKLESLNSKNSFEIISHSREETIKIATRFAGFLNKNDVVALYGELGSGKTFFVRKVAEALKCPVNVTSPTFVILNEYFGKFPLFHFDFYRIENESELVNIGFTEYLNKDGVIFVEWPRVAENLLPENYISAKFKIVDENSRKINVSVNK